MMAAVEGHAGERSAKPHGGWTIAVDFHLAIWARTNRHGLARAGNDRYKRPTKTGY